MKFLVLILRILLGSVFVFSGIIKLYPIEPFEYNFVDLGVATWSSAPYIARGMISFEVCIGVLLIAGFRLRKFSLPVTIGTLIFFSMYLVIQLITKGNSDNCGCFGTFLAMTPVESMVKNVILLVVAVFLYIKNDTFLATRQIWLIPLLGALSITLVFVLNMPDSYFLKDYDPGYETGEIDYNTLPSTFSDSVTYKMDEGKKLICFFSINCPHCKQAAIKLSIVKRKHPDLQAFVYFWGNPARKEEFIKETQMELPYVFYKGPDYMRIVGGNVPAIFYLENGKIIARWDKMNMDMERIEKELLR